MSDFWWDLNSFLHHFRTMLWTTGRAMVLLLRSFLLDSPPMGTPSSWLALPTLVWELPLLDLDLLDLTPGKLDSGLTMRWGSRYLVIYFDILSYSHNFGLISHFNSILSFQICNFLSQGATQAWDTPQDVPYAYNSQNVWVGYDNIKSFQIKVFSIHKALNVCRLAKGSFGP